MKGETPVRSPHILAVTAVALSFGLATAAVAQTLRPSRPRRPPQAVRLRPAPTYPRSAWAGSVRAAFRFRQVRNRPATPTSSGSDPAAPCWRLVRPEVVGGSPVMSTPVLPSTRASEDYAGTVHSDRTHQLRHN